tara:strand:+ start:285 stop:740 length:456 start_codon:yes stop_codon:yes gene_type:complete
MKSNKYISDEDIITICRSSQSMRQAAFKLNMSCTNLKRRAVKLGCYMPNMSGKGIRKPKVNDTRVIPLKDILDGKHPKYERKDLKRRLLREGILENVCSICSLTEWVGEALIMHLDHKNGVCNDNRLENLRMLCPNCHSQTHTYGGRNIKK